MIKINIDWPAVYLQESKDEELMYISSGDWNHDVDSHHAIGPLNKETDHYLVDSKGSVYQLSNPFTTDAGCPHFEFKKVEKSKIVELVKIRAKNQLDIVPQNFSRLVKELDYN